MATRLSVFNDAMGLLGQPLLDSDEQAGEDGDVLRGHWDSVVDLAHEKTAWDHAKVIVALSLLAETPPARWTYYYQLPGDLLRLLWLSQSGGQGDDLTDYEIVVGKVGTHAASVYAGYVSDVSRTAVGRWSESFAHYVATELAFRSAPKLNPSALAMLKDERKKALSDAVGLDATQGPPIRRRHGSWSGAARGFLANRNREQR